MYKYPKIFSKDLCEQFDFYFCKKKDEIQKIYLMRKLIESEDIQKHVYPKITKHRIINNPSSIQPFAFLLHSCVEIFSRLPAINSTEIKNYKHALKRMGKGCSIILENMRVTNNSPLCSPPHFAGLNDLSVLIHATINEAKKAGKIKKNELIIPKSIKGHFPSVYELITTCKLLTQTISTELPKFQYGRRTSSRKTVNSTHDFFIHNLIDFNKRHFNRYLFDIVTTITNVIFDKNLDEESIKKRRERFKLRQSAKKQGTIR